MKKLQFTNKLIIDTAIGIGIAIGYDIIRLSFRISLLIVLLCFQYEINITYDK
jgi:hypothetical protein